ncbi:hypothetical protein ACHWQZ_G007112 [Mnemiopsis leidyi]
MKKFLYRAPSYSCFIHLPFRSVSNQAAKLNTPLGENIEVNSDILRSLRLNFYKLNSELSSKSRRQGGNTVYELQTLETRSARMPTIPITRMEDWREISRNVLEKARCYPVCVHQNLLEHCQHLVFSSPQDRRKLLDEIITTLIEQEYPVNKILYNSYLSTVWNLRLNVNLDQVFEDLRRLNLPLSYDNHDSVKLSDTVCSFLSLHGDSAAISQCFETFSTSRNFHGFTDRAFGNVAAAHVTRGEFDELFELQSTLERSGPVKLGYRYYSNVMFSLARTGNLELLETLLRKDKMACVTGFESHFATLCVELVNSGNEDYISKILPVFNGLYFPWGRTLEKLVCDLLSRGAVRIGADLLVHGADIFEFPNQKQIDIYESETLPDVMQNMTDNLDNILIQLELRGINTEYSFDFDKISDDVVDDIDNLAGEFPESDWIHKLYANKMDRTIMT